jgi:hypothetical protein
LATDDIHRETAPQRTDGGETVTLTLRTPTGRALRYPPCNKEKRDRYTLIGLQQHNRDSGWMKNEANLPMGRAQGRARKRRLR